MKKTILKINSEFNLDNINKDTFLELEKSYNKIKLLLQKDEILNENDKNVFLVPFERKAWIHGYLKIEANSNIEAFEYAKKFIDDNPLDNMTDVVYLDSDTRSDEDGEVDNIFIKEFDEINIIHLKEDKEAIQIRKLKELKECMNTLIGNRYTFKEIEKFLIGKCGLDQSLSVADNDIETGNDDSLIIDLFDAFGRLEILYFKTNEEDILYISEFNITEY